MIGRSKTPALIAVTALVVLLCASSAHAQEPRIASLVPAAASADVTIRITGSGFGSTAGANQVTFTPASGSPVDGLVTAVSAADATGTLRRLTVRVPQGLPTGPAAISVRNTTTGLAGGGASVEIVALSPSVRVVNPGQSLDLDILLQGNAAFDPASSRVTLGEGVSVTRVTVASPTRLVASVTVATAATVGPRTLSVLTPVLTASAAEALRVEALQPGNSAPTAVLAGPSDGATGEALVFDGSQSSDPDGDSLSHSWSFGDGTSASGVTATKSFAQAGTFVVTLTVTDGRGGIASATRSVTISAPPPANQPPTARFTASSLSIEAGQSVAFDASASSDPDGDPLSFEWSFGDGGAATGVSASRTYASATGSPFTVTLTVRDGRGGVDTASQAITVRTPAPANRPPVATLSVTTTTPQVGDPVGFDASASTDPDGDPLTFTWSFGDGATASAVSATHTYLSAGTFTVTLTVNDGRGGIATAQAVVTPSAPTAGNRPPSAAITSFASGIVNEPFAFSGAASSDPDGDPLTYRWLFGDGTEGTGRDVTRTYLSPGAYTVTLTVTDGRGGRATTVRGVTVGARPAQNAAPVAVITAPAVATVGQPVVFSGAGSSDADGDPLSFVWAFGDGTGGGGVTAAKTFAAPGAYTVTLSVSDGRGGLGTATHAIAVNAPVQTNRAPTPVILSADRVVTGRTLLVNAGASSDPDGDPLSYAWDFGDGTTASGEHAAHAFAAAGTFTITLTADDGRGGRASTAKSVRVDDAQAANRAPRAVIGGATEGVTGVDLVFDGRGSSDPDGDALDFAWTFGVTGATASGATAVFAYGRAGAFTVTLTVTDTAGNSDTATRSIDIEDAPDRAPPIVSLGGPVEALPGAQVLFTATATDNVGVVAVRFEVEGLAGAEPTELAVPPYTRALTLPGVVSPGQQVRVTALARDAAGNVGSASATVSITNLPDTTEPTVALVAPPRAAAGASISLLARAGDDRGVARVVFMLDGAEVATDDAAPFETTAAIPAGAQPGTSVLALARAVDLSGNTAESAAEIAIVAAPDTIGPSVTLDTPLEVVAGTPLAIAATAQDDTGVASVAFDVDGAALPPVVTPPYQATYQVPASALPGSRLAVRAVARDFSNNTGEATRAVKVISAPASTRGVITGEVYDDTTGLPLAGATVALTGTDALGGAYAETALTDARGRYLLRASAGTGRLVVSKAGHTRVHRAVTVRGGVAVEAFDARLTPIDGRDVIVSSVLGGSVEESGVALAIEPGSLTADAAMRLVAVGQQGLANRLPAGWSPVAAVEVLPRTARFTGGARLRVTNVYSLPPAAPLVLAGYDETAGAWVARAMAEVDAGGQVIAGEVPGGGQYVFLLADTVPVAPPPAVVGQALQGVSAPVLPTALDASLAPRPRILFYSPSARSVVSGNVAAAAPLSSGSPLHARVSEQYAFQDGGVITTLPFVADLTFFQVGAGANALGASAPVTPSLAFEPIALREGVITVELLVPGEGDGTPLSGPDGAILAGPNGEQLQVPFGALDAQTPIAIETLAAADLGVPVPDGLSLVAGAQIDFQGVLAAEGTFSVPAPPGLGDASRLLLVQVRAVGGQTRWVLRGVMRLAGDRLVSSTRVGDEATALTGVREPGRYLVVEIDGPVGFAGGLVTAADASPARGALVSTSTMPVVALTGTDGGFLAAGRAGANTFAALDLVRSDAASATAALVAGTVAPLGLSLSAQAPRVTRVTPADQLTGVALSTPVVITFSEPIDPASVTGEQAGNVLLFDAGGTVVAGTLALSSANAVVTFRPASPLLPNTRYTLVVATGVRDVSGYGLAQPFQSSFSSLDTAPPPPPPAGAITAGIPDAQGRTTIRATQGTASPRDTVTILNVRTGAVTPVLIEPNGGFTVTVPVSLSDRLRVRIVDASGNETAVDLDGFRQVNADGSLSVVVGADGGVVEGPGGTGARIKPGTFPDGAVVTIKPVDVATLPVNIDPALAGVLSMQAALEIDFGGATPQQYVDLVFPARGDEQPDGDWIVTQVVEFYGQRLLNAVDTAKFKQGRIVTSSPPCPGVTAAGLYGAMKSTQSVGINYSQFYNQYGTQWPMVMETAFLPVGGFVALPFVSLSPVVAPYACYPVLSGRATVVPNGTRLRIAGDQLAPRDREVIVTNNMRGTTQRFPRNVVELTLDMTGTLSDAYTVTVAGPGGEQAVTSLVVSSAPQAETVVLRLDMDLIAVPVSTVTIRNLTRGIERVYNVPLQPFEVGVAGGPGDSYAVEVVTAGGQKRAVFGEALVGPYGPGNFLLKVQEGTIDPSAAELPPGSGGLARERVRLTSSSGLDLVIPDDQIVMGGVKFAFDADQADEFRLIVEYASRPSISVRIPSFRLTVTNPQTGRVIRTITAPAPPRDEPLELAPISDDVRPPRVVSGPTRLTSFDPAGYIEFRFSEPMNAASIASLANFVVRGANGQQVLGEFRVSDFNRRVTFVPASPLKLGTEYTVTLKGNDSLGQLIEPGQGTGMTDRSGNPLPTLRLTLKTVSPRLLGAYGSDFAIKDPVIRVRTVEGPGGPQRKTYVVATTAGSGEQDKVISIDVTQPESPVRAGGSSAKAPTRQWITVLENASFTSRDGTAFSGDLAFASTFNTFYTFGDWYDVTDPAAPRHLGGKIFTTNPDNVTGFNSQGTLKVLGFGKGVAMLPTSQGVTSYIAIEKVGVAAANTSENVPERSPQDRMLEPYYQGDFTDVVAYGAQLLALERTARRLEVLSPDLAPTASIELPDAPRRVRTVTGLAVDVDRDGLITPDEQFDLAVVGAEGAVLLVDLAAIDSPRVISRIPLPGVTVRSLDIDAERKRLFASDFGRIFMIDLSRPTQEFSSDGDGDGYDDRVIWHAAGSANGIAIDAARGLIYVTTNSGLDIWSVYDSCCDLGVDMVAPKLTRQVGDRETLLAKEKLGLQTGIAKGLAEGGCGNVTILEQGSGACLWKPDPVAACADNYQPGLSDHDFEVFFADAGSAAAKACITALSAQFTDPVTKAPKEIELSTGGTIAFEDISFFPVSRAEFENAKLNVNPPEGSGSDGAVGDLGLGRQQLLLKWLLEGEYVEVPGQTLAGAPLDDILDRLRTQTGIPRLEGHEWGTLMAFNLAKSKVYLRIAGATSGESAFYEFSLKQLHDAGKAGIRATLARLVDHPGGAALVLDVTRERYATSGCRAISPIIENPMEWPVKPCTSFEEYVASAAARSLLTIPTLGIFTRDEVALQVNRFYRVKADQERIGDDATADAFLRLAHRFVQDTKTLTAPTFIALVGQDADGSQRLTNVQTAVTATADALAHATAHVVPRVYNRGFRGGPDLSVKYFVQPPGQATAAAGDVRVTLSGGDEQHLAYKRRPDGTIEVDDKGAAVKQFVLGPIDVTRNRGQLGHFVFTIDLPERTMQEANRENNIGGAFFYVLDPDGAGAPVIPSSLPNPPGVTEDTLRPDPGCDEGPSLRVTESVVIDGRPYNGTVALGTGQQITVRLQVRNFSSETVTGVVACDTLGNLCYDVGTLAAGQTWTRNIDFTVPELGAVVEGQPSVFSATAGVQTGATLRIVSACEAYAVTTYDPDPNPTGEASTVMAGGKAVRWYRVIRRDTGDPAPGVSVQVSTTGSVNGTFTFTTDGEGLVSVGDVPGLAIGAPATASGPFVARFTKVGGANFACTIPPEFTVTVKPFEFTDSLKLGAAVSGAFALATGKASLGLGGSLTLALTGQQNGGSPTFSKLQLSRSVEVKGGFGVEKKLFEVGLAVGATAQLSGPAATGTVGVALTAGDKFLFPTLPLGSADAAAIAGITLDTVSRAQALTGPAGVITDFVQRRLAARATGYASKRISYSFGMSASVGVSASAFSFKAGLGNALFQGDPAIGVGLGAEAKGTFGVSFEHKIPDQQVVGTLDLSAEASAALSIDAATLAEDAKIDLIPADGSVRKAGKDQTTKIATRLKTIASFGGGISEGGKIIVTTDASGDSLKVKKLEASFVGRKQFGMKVVGSAVTNDGEGQRDTVTFTADDRRVIDEILKVMPAVTALTTPAAVSGIPNPAPPIINLPGPTSINEKIVEFARLIFSEGTYTVSRERGNGLAVPIGFNIRVLGTGVDALATPSADHTVSHTREKGVFRGLREFRLEDYSGVSIPLEGGIGTVGTFISALTGISFDGEPGISPAQRSFNESTGTGEISTTNSARLRLTGRGDYEKVQDVIGVAYTGVAGPLRPEPYRPEQTEGPTGRPRYGLGGFHYFDPAGATLENPATLVMDYYDHELPGIDEATIRIYRWNEDRNDWDFVGGSLDMAANTVTATVTRLGTYTLGARMPAGDIAFTVVSAQVSDAGLPSASTVVVLESGVIGQNDGTMAPEGTVIHLRSLAPFGAAAEQVPFGVITSPDASELEGMQAVVGADGRIRLTVELPGVQNALRIYAFSDVGTALGDRVTPVNLP